MSAALTIEQLIEQLARLPQAARVLINNQSGLPFTYAVTGVVAAQHFDVGHLFDKSIAPPAEGRLCVSFNPHRSRLMSGEQPRGTQWTHRNPLTNA